MNSQLTDRELEVLALFAQQKTNREIARDLSLTLGTVKWYAQQIYNKLGVSDRKSAVSRAQVQGLLSAPSAQVEPAEPQHNLPAQMTSFVGREAEIEQVKAALTSTRLLTLTGPGGVGKTRLALEAASQLLDRFPDGIFWIPLFGIDDPQLIAGQLVEELGLQETRQQAVVPTLQRYLRNKQMLLVLDNFEHLLEGAVIVPQILTAAAQLRLLVTSREILHVVGEQEITVPPLTANHGDGGVSPDGFESHPALDLFVQRARAVNPGFQANEETVPLIQEICERLDGLPLAVELAAARSKLFSPQAMLARLDNSLATLSNRVLDSAGRHLTLRETIGWSFALLTEEEQTIFGRLSVFAGGFSMQGVDALCPDLQPEVILNGLASLNDKSLISQEVGSDGEPRFRMLQTIRQYAREHLDSLGEIERVQLRHASYYSSLAQQKYEAFLAGAYRLTMDTLSLELDNLRASWRRLTELLETNPETQDAIEHLDQLVAPACWYFLERSLYSEGKSTCLEASRAIETQKSDAPDDSVPATPREVLLARVLIRLADFHYSLGEYEQVDWAIQRALPVAERAGLPYEIAFANEVLAKANYRRGATGEARTILGQSIDMYRDLGKRLDETRALVALSNALVSDGEYDQAIASMTQSLEQYRAMNYTVGVAFVTTSLASCYERHGQPEAARPLLEEAQAIALRDKNRFMIMFATSNLASVMSALGEQETAEVERKKALAQAEELGEQHWIATNLNGLSRIYLRMGQLDDVRVHARQALQTAHKIGDVPAMMSSMGYLGQVWAQQGRREDALRALYAVEQSPGAWAWDKSMGADLLAELTNTLPENRVHDERSWTRNHSLDELVAWALEV